MRYLILGATGTLGRETIKQLLKKDDTKEILCLSRDELKLSELYRDFDDERISTLIGDIRDKASIVSHFKGVDTVFHFAALKRIPEAERQPIECIKTNLMGTINAAECAVAYGVKHFMFSSTDKACLPINVYGACKFTAERVLLSFNKEKSTNFSVYRWGNILGSRGSVIYAFKDSIENNLPAMITHKDMTRFWIKIEDAVKFVLSTYQEKSNEVRVPQMKSASVLELLGAIGTVMKKVPAYVLTGMRPGEKIHEDILFNPTWSTSVSSGNYAQYSKDELLKLAGEILK